MLATWGTSTGRNPTLDLQFAGATSLDNRITFSRGSQATLFDSTGALVYAPNNVIRNNTMVGAVAGTPGTLPTNWSVFAASGLTTTVVATGISNGVSYIDLRFSGTSTNTFYVFAFDNSAVTASAGQNWTESFWVSLVGGSLANISSCNVNIRWSTGSADIPFTATTTFTRISGTAVAPAGITNVIPALFINMASGAAIDITLRIGMPQLELGSVATAVNATSGTAYYGPRFDYNPSTLAAQGLLIEEARTNSIRNNTMQGAVAGTPGTAPTNWAVSGRGTLTQTVVGTGTSNNINYIDIRFNGTTSTTEINMAFESGTQIVSAQNQTWASSLYCGISAGSLTNISTIRQIIISATAAGATLSASTQTFTPTTAAISTQRNAFAYTLPDVTNARVYSRLDILFSSGVAIDITLRIGLPQLELGAFATSVIPTTTTALTRSADVATMTGTNFSSWYNATAGTLSITGSTFGSATTNRRMAFMTDGSTNNRIGLLFNASNRGQFLVVSSSSVVANPENTVVAITSPSRIAAAYALDDYAMSINGAAVVTDNSGALPSGVNQMSIGSQLSNEFVNGYIQRIAYYPTRLANSTLQALTG